MDTENGSRADLALPTPQEPSSVPEIELSEVPCHDSSLLEKAAPSPPHRTWLTFLKRELEFLGVTQILIGLKCLCFGTIVYSTLKISEFEEDFFLSFKTGYPFWGAVIFVISGLLSVMSERKQATYLVSCNPLFILEKVRGSLGANLISSVAAAAGMVILVTNLRNSSAYIYVCQEAYEDDFCLAAFFSTKIVAMILFLTILGFGSAVSLTVYGIGELLKKEKIPEDILYEELNIYSPIYSELEDRGETSSPADS